MERLYKSVITEHFQLNKQMAFMCGPRQVGKTTIAHELQKGVEQSLYRSWDSPDDRNRLLSPTYGPVLEGITLSPAIHPLVIFDEIHKFPDWKNYLKGLYDTYQGQMDLLVTGSARLNVFRKGGDSLMGRYFLYRVHPLTVAEKGYRSIGLFQAPTPVSQELIHNLLYFGGFPEPLSKGNERFLNQWRHLRQQQSTTSGKAGGLLRAAQGGQLFPA
jgi:predicted AAA+ superfamily ATPase